MSGTALGCALAALKVSELQGAGLGLGVLAAFVLGVWAVFFLVDPNR